MWSGPRNLSTAMMRAFENRADTVVWDEPLYAAYLQTTGIEHPMREAVIAAGEPDWVRVAARCGAPCDGADVFYQKHMTHHLLPDMSRDWLSALQHGFLLRDPKRVLLSYSLKRESVSLDDIGIEQQWAVFQHVADRIGEAPVVVDSDVFLTAPEAHLRMMCSRWGIAFSSAMLSWPAGARASDGAWAPHWYASVWASTGFGPARAPETGTLPSHLQRILDQAQPLYEKLLAHAQPVAA